MRIITGIAKGIRLETLEGISTRPTGGRVKEAIFNAIQFDIEGRKVLDLFAGSGQMGLEALSRGAARADFVDSNLEAVAIIKRNAQKAKLYDKCRVMNSEYKRFLRGAMGKEQYHIIFCDPPYGERTVPEMANDVLNSKILSNNGILICESAASEPVEVEGLKLHRYSKYGSTDISIYIKETGEEI